MTVATVIPSGTEYFLTVHPQYAANRYDNRQRGENSTGHQFHQSPGIIQEGLPLIIAVFGIEPANQTSTTSSFTFYHQIHFVAFNI